MAAATLEMFCEAYGAEAGNLALKIVATGGVYVAGGIAPRLVPGFHTAAFLRGFRDKGRFAKMMESLSVAIVMNPRMPLVGAAHYGLRFC